MRAIVALAVKRRVTVAMTALAVVAFGFVGYSRLSLELFPDISYPSLTVQTEFPDTAPEEVENLVTREVEEAVGVLRGLQTIHSVSRSGISEVTLEFDWGSDMDLLSMEVREKLDRLVLPEEAEDPIVLRFDPSLDPIVRLALSTNESAAGDGSRESGTNGGSATSTDGEAAARGTANDTAQATSATASATGSGLAESSFESRSRFMELRHLAERRIKPDLETLDGIASASVKGGLEEEIQIEIDQERLAALGIPLERVRQIVAASNVNLPGGALRGEDREFLIRTVNEFDDLDEIRRLIVWQEGDALVRLEEVADVYLGAKEREEITRVDGARVRSSWLSTRRAMRTR